jgi:hypothetical protein
MGGSQDQLKCQNFPPPCPPSAIVAVVGGSRHDRRLYVLGTHLGGSARPAASRTRRGEAGEDAADGAEGMSRFGTGLESVGQVDSLVHRVRCDDDRNIEG